jgi:hypothetical protein
MTTTTDKIYFVCDRLQIINPSQCQNVSYQEHMTLAMNSLIRYEVGENQEQRYRDILTSFIKKGMRHCDFFRILYDILYEWKPIEDASIEEVLQWKYDEGNYYSNFSQELECFIDIIETTKF